MREPRDPLYLADMVAACEKILRYVQGRSLESFAEDDLLQDAVLRNLTVLGEAATKIGRDVIAAHPEIPWQDIAGMRHRVVHDYGHVDLEAVWAAVQGEFRSF
jgi:uncharacterized protein with HEPN domain